MTASLLPTPPPLKHIKDNATRVRLLELRERVAPILGNNLLPHFTDHSVNHSDSLARLVDDLIEPLQAGGQPLTDEELSILYSACYLHDIGMQYENADKTQVVSSLRLAQPWKDLSEDTRRRLLRENHAAISAEMVIMSVRAQEPPIGIQLKHDHYAKYVAPLCEGHTLSTNSERYFEIIKDGPNIRTELLSALLRMADILDLSQRRANRDKALTLALDLESQTHWWRHHYTENIEIDQHQKVVSIWFDFPKTHFDEYSKIVPQLQMPWIEAEFSRHTAVFNRYGLGWTVKAHIEPNAFSVVEVMPTAVESEMLKQVYRQQRWEQEKQHYLVAQQISEAKPHIESRLAELESRKDAVTTGEYIKGIRDIATDLSEIGGKRSAWILLSEHFTPKSAALDSDDRLDIGTTLATMMIEDDMIDRAVFAVRELLPLAEQLKDDDPRKLSLWKLWANCLVELGDYREAVPFIERTIGLTSDVVSRAELQAELAELHFLNGDLAKAMTASTSTKGSK